MYELSEEYFHYLLIFLGVASTAFGLSSFVRYVLGRFLSTNSKVIKVDPTNYAFLKNATSLIIFTFAFFALTYIIPPLRMLGTTLFASAGVLAAIFGFASQQALSNIVGGIFIVIFKPIRVGDLVEVKGVRGTVEDITLRHTVIKDFENKRIIIPNTTMGSEVIVNNHIVDERIHRRIVFNLSLNTNFAQAAAIVIEELKKHPNYIDGRTEEAKEKGEPEIEARLTFIGEYYFTLTAYAWAENSSKAFDMHTDVNLAVKLRFEAEGIEFPIPNRNIFQPDQQVLR